MTDRERNSSSDLAKIETKEITIREYAAYVFRRWKLILGLFSFAIAAATVITMTSAKIYESTATLLAPREGGSNLLGGLATWGVLQQVPGSSVPSLAPNRDMLLGILRSRAVAQAAVERFSLQARYRVRYLEDAIKTLQGMMNISISREGVISVRAQDIDPRVAADIANFFVEELDRLAGRYGMGEAGHQRMFFSEQLARAKVDLESAEQKLRRFQERNRAVALQEQTKGAIEAAARLKAEIAATEVQLQVIRNFATEVNPEVIALRRRAEEMRRQLGQMQYGDQFAAVPAVPEQDRRDFVVPLPRLPEVGLELARLTRDVKVQETLVTLLIQQVEQARIAAAKDLPVVQVLDRAMPAERHTKPRLMVNLAIAAVSGLFSGVFLAFLLEGRATREGSR
jgi:uncharacterized protein involved in exopolysaccharide biosynthesis